MRDTRVRFLRRRTTSRGFRIYAETTDVYGSKVAIVESSSVAPQLWIQSHPTDSEAAGRGKASVLFTATQARHFANALLAAAEEQTK